MNEFDVFLLNILNVIDSNYIQDEDKKGVDDNGIKDMRNHDQCGIYQN